MTLEMGGRAADLVIVMQKMSQATRGGRVQEVFRNGSFPRRKGGEKYFPVLQDSVKAGKTELGFIVLILVWTTSKS